MTSGEAVEEPELANGVPRCHSNSRCEADSPDDFIRGLASDVYGLPPTNPYGHLLCSPTTNALNSGYWGSRLNG